VELVTEAGPDAVRGEFGELFYGHAARMVRLAALLGADDPENVAQEAFVRLFQSWGKARDPVSYLQRTVVNLVRGRHRHLGVVRRKQPPPPRPAESAEEAVVVRDEHRQILRAVDRLPPRQRESVVLRYWLDLSDAEAGERMGVSPTTVRGHISRALRELADILEGQA
jgi:RNA polymerase sigma factor (sigma-70 family)